MNTLIRKNILLLLLLFSFTYSVETIDTSDLSLMDKIAQMIMVRINGEFYNDEHWRKKSVVKLIQEYNIGGIITYTGSIHGTHYNINEFQDKSQIPLFVAADYERGLGQFIDGTLFPSNMAISATGNPLNSYTQGEITAKEAISIGVNMIFAPVLDINNNPNNPIINFRSYGDNAETVINFSTPFIQGIQDQGLIACGKHFPGHGDTDADSHTSLPVINKTVEELYSNELLPFKNACDINIKSIMIGHVLFPNIDKNNPATLSKKITNDILRKQWEYEGLIITDALEMGAISEITWHEEAAVRAVEAGADIILLPLNSVSAIKAIYDAVKEGRISEKRINDSFFRIIEQKERLLPIYDRSKNLIEAKSNIKIYKNKLAAQKIANESITIVKNENNLIPLNVKKYEKITHIMLSMDDGVKSRFKSHAKDINLTHGNVNEIIVNDKLSKLQIKDISKKLRGSDLVVISMLVRIKMDKGISTIDKTHNELIEKIHKMKIPILGISFGSPYLPDYSKLNTYICAYGYGNVSIKAATNCIFGRIDINGKLPVDLNNIYKKGHGIKLSKLTSSFKNKDYFNIDSAVNLIKEGIKDSIFPGAQIFVSRGDRIIANEGYGHTSYEDVAHPVTSKTIYDLASLTKVVSTVPVVMKLIEKKKLSLDFSISDFYPEYNTDDKKHITIRHLLTHSSGLKNYIEYYKYKNYNRQEIINNILNLPLEYLPDTKTVYSDLGMILLLDIIEQITGSSLDELSSKYIYKPLNMENTFFNPNDNYYSIIAPTELDDYFRMKLLKGIVHDENAYILGGVSGHAGLFSNAQDLGVYCKMLIDDGYYLGNRLFSRENIAYFTRRQNITQSSDYALGWDTPSQNGRSSAGDFFSKNTFGHLGFTGTSMWIDSDNDLIVILLTNRVYPTRNKFNINKKMYTFRREFHNLLVSEILQ